MGKYNFENLDKKYGDKSYYDNMAFAIINDKENELKWYYLQKKKMNKGNYIIDFETNNHQKITLTNPNYFFVMNMVKNGDVFGIKPTNWPNGFIKAKFVGSVIVGGKKINQKFKIVEVELNNEDLENLEKLCFGEDDLFKSLKIRKGSIWFKG